jgi:hypothetical protein
MKTQNKEIKQRKSDQLMLLIFKAKFLKTSADLQTAFAAETHRTEGQWLEEQRNTVKFHMCRIGTRMQTASRRKSQYLAPMKRFIKKKAQELAAPVLQFHKI